MISRQAVLGGAIVAYLAAVAWLWAPGGGGGGPSPPPLPDGDVDQAIVDAMKQEGTAEAARQRAQLYAGIAEMIESQLEIRTAAQVRKMNQLAGGYTFGGRIGPLLKVNAACEVLLDRAFGGKPQGELGEKRGAVVEAFRVMSRSCAEAF